MSILQHAQDADARMPWLQKQLCWWRGKCKGQRRPWAGQMPQGCLTSCSHLCNLEEPRMHDLTELTWWLTSCSERRCDFAQPFRLTKQGAVSIPYLRAEDRVMACDTGHQLSRLLTKCARQDFSQALRGLISGGEIQSYRTATSNRLGLASWKLI